MREHEIVIGGGVPEMIVCGGGAAYLIWMADSRVMAGYTLGWCGENKD